jgi:hypothetical protein
MSEKACMGAGQKDNFWHLSMLEEYNGLLDWIDL